MGNKVFMFGDVHLSSINTWNFKAGENFIKWFTSHNFGDKENTEMIFVGDIAERDVNPGNVVDQMWRLFKSASDKSKAVYVVCGNHDKKLYHGVEQHSLKFLENLSNVRVYEKEEEVTSENGYKMLILPWQAKASEGITLHDYYNKISENYKGKTYDIITGHWQIKEPNGPVWAQDGVELKNYHAHCYAIGHIHLRLRPEYTGSIFPNTVAEQNDDYPRGYKVYENGVETFEPLPCFLKYVTLKLGDEKPVEDSNCAYAYIITDCNSEIEAKEKYPDLEIKGIERNVRKVTLNADSNGNSDSVMELSNKYIKDLYSAFTDMVKENNIKLSRNVNSLVKSVLTA